MKFVFLGTPEFAAIILEKLMNEGLIPEAVICNPDRPSGRKKIKTSPLVKVMAEWRNIKVLQPEDPLEILPALGEIKPDILVVAAYAKILPEKIIRMPMLGAVGVHPSLLPKYRGASPIQSAILNGDKETGTTLYLLDDRMDHGPIIAQRKLKDYKPGETGYAETMKKLAELSGELAAETLPKYFNGEIKPKAQDEINATYTKKISTNDAFVEEKDLEQAVGGKAAALAGDIHRKILAMTPEPGVWTLKGGKRVKLLESELRDGKLVLKVIQTEGQKPVRVQ